MSIDSRVRRAIVRLAVFGIALGAITSYAQMKSGEQMAGFGEVFGVSVPPGLQLFTVALVASSTPGNVLFSGEQPRLTFRITNKAGQPIEAEARVRVIAYGTRGIAGNNWLPQVYKIADVGAVPVPVRCAARGSVDVTVALKIPDRFGGYACVIDIPGRGSVFGTSLIRTFPAHDVVLQFPRLSLDPLPLDVLDRLGIQAVRYEVDFVPSTDPGYLAWRQRLRRSLAELHAHKITALVMFLNGSADQPLGMPRPHLDSSGVMLPTKSDHAWLPALDPDFERTVASVCRESGWPRGPVTAVSLWNEPWEGISISGWGADMLRYRAIYRAMARGIEQARRSGVQVLMGGADSSSNTLDKLFPDGSDEFLNWLDVCTVHYQGLSAPTLIKAWRHRSGAYGRVRIWDTESWIANTDDRVAPVIAGMLAAGYDRTMGVYGGNVAQPVTPLSGGGEGGEARLDTRTVTTWSTAAAVGAVHHFIGERPFDRLLFQNGLPWIFVFDGLDRNPDDGTVVVVGDLGGAFEPDKLPFRTVEQRAAGSPPSAPPGDELGSRPLQRGGGMTLRADGSFALYDGYGNLVPARADGSIRVPLDTRGFFLRGNGSKGSFGRLLAALRSARIDAYEPLNVVVHDPLRPILDGGVVRLTLTNILNRSVEGELRVGMSGLPLDYPTRLGFGPHETKDILVRVTGGAARPDNNYDLVMHFDAGPDGRVEHREIVHVDYVVRLSPKVDGRLDDWHGAPPQTVHASGDSAPSLAEAAWYPFERFNASVKRGLATAYLAYDDRYFYFAAKIADDSPDPGTYRFAARDDDSFFYPKVVYKAGTPANGRHPGGTNLRALHWPAGVRQFSYRRNVVLPSGESPAFDNVQIAFGVRAPGEGRLIAAAPGTMPGFVPAETTDYEYALNQVAPEYGGGTEIWRLAVPGMPRKHFYPRQPKSPFDGAVAGGKLVIRREGNTRFVEAALPWSEIPLVKQAVAAGRPVRFSYRVNDNDGPSMELAAGRSVSLKNSAWAFHDDWVDHWSNEVEFGFAR